MTRRFKIIIQISLFICCAGIAHTCTAFQVLIKYNNADCAKCLTSYPTIVRDFENIEITIFDQVKDLNEIKSKLIYLDSSVKYSNDLTLIKRFASYPGNTLIIYDKDDNWVITSLSTNSYFDKRDELKKILNNSCKIKKVYIDTTVSSSIFSISKKGVYLLSSSQINYYSQNNNIKSSYTIKFDSVFFNEMQGRMNWSNFNYEDVFNSYSSINPKLKSMVSTPISIIGNARLNDEFHVSLNVNEYKLLKNKSIVVVGHHCLFLVFNDAGLKDAKAYKYDNKHDIDFTSFKIIDSTYLATFTQGKRNRLWSKNIVTIETKSNDIFFKIKSKKRDHTYFKLYRDIKDKKQYFENAYVTDNAVVYYIAGYFGIIKDGKLKYTFKYGDNLDILNKSKVGNDEFWNDLTLYSDIVVEDEIKYILLSNRDGHQLHVVGNSGNICRYYLGSRNLNISPRLVFENGKVEVNLFDIFSGEWIQNIYTFRN